MSDPRINILTYHSISDTEGPTSISADVFQGQMDVLFDCGYQVVPLSDIAAWHRGETELPPRSVVITFDDGFADFSSTAAPILQSRGWTATVFLPSGCLGGSENWDGRDGPARPLMSWQQVGELADAGIDFGSHSVSHADLTSLPSDELRRELTASRDHIAERLGSAPVCFAPPYGQSNPAVREEIKKLYSLSVGTDLQRAGRRSDLFDLPRIEMYYFRDLTRWRSHLEGHGELYFGVRRGLRRIRELVTR